MNQDKYAHCVHPYPVRHRRKVPFSPEVEVPSSMVERLVEIRNLDHELDRFILSEQDSLDVMVEALSVNIHQSVKLEGNPLALWEVSRVTRVTLSDRAFRIKESSRREVRNHVFVWTNPERWALPWSLETVRALHATLFDGVDGDYRPGELTRKQMVVVSDKGEELFYGCVAGSVAEELASLFEWVNRRSGVYAPIVAAAVFFHEFESIHPFEEGNGRMGRTMFHLLLEMLGLPNSRFCQVEKYLIQDPELYYRILGWTDHKGSYLELVDYFTDALLLSYRDAVKILGEKDLLTHGLDETSRRLLVQARRTSGWFSVREASAWIGGRSDQTIRSHLNALVERGALKYIGETRSRRYAFSPPRLGGGADQPGNPAGA